MMVIKYIFCLGRNLQICDSSWMQTTGSCWALKHAVLTGQLRSAPQRSAAPGPGWFQGQHRRVPPVAADEVPWCLAGAALAGGSHEWYNAASASVLHGQSPWITGGAPHRPPSFTTHGPSLAVNSPMNYERLIWIPSTISPMLTPPVTMNINGWLYQCLHVTIVAQTLWLIGLWSATSKSSLKGHVTHDWGLKTIIPIILKH